MAEPKKPLSKGLQNVHRPATKAKVKTRPRTAKGIKRDARPIFNQALDKKLNHMALFLGLPNRKDMKTIKGMDAAALAQALQEGLRGQYAAGQKKVAKMNEQARGSGWVYQYAPVKRERIK